MEATAVSGAAIAKRLASCNKSTRDRAVRLLTTWLPHQSSAAISDADLLKIWKGLFYCVWHSDKLPTQLDLINRLSSLLQTLNPSLSARYFDSFLLTLRREWPGIDFLRLDKFYLLIRKFLHHFFLFLKNHGWHRELVDRLVGILSERSLLAVDKFQAQGVNYQFAEIFLDEIEEFLPVAPETLEVLLKPFLEVLERSSDKVLVNKIKVSVFDRLVENGRRFLELESSGGGVKAGKEVEQFGRIALVLGFSKKFFGLASAAETVQGNRKVLFGLHESFLKLEKDLEKSGFSVSLQHLGNGNSVEKTESLVMESTEQVKMNSGICDGGSDDRPVKKRKKSKKVSDGVDKKCKPKKKKNKSPESAIETNGSASLNEINGFGKGEDANNANAEDAKGNVDAKGSLTGDENLITFDETVISNLQKQFEKVAAEAGIITAANLTVTKKRKRAKSAEGKATIRSNKVNGASTGEKSGEKSVKKVRFSMKNNLVWKPQNPLPPQSLRLPPSVTPRGSALKKGIPPGPVRESPPTVKKIKVKGSSVKKGRKTLKSISPAVKRLRKLQGLSV